MKIQIAIKTAFLAAGVLMVTGCGSSGRHIPAATASETRRTPAQVQPHPMPPLVDNDGRTSLRTLLQTAVRVSPRVLAAGESLLAWRAQRPFVTRLPDPMVMVGWAAEEVRTRTGDQKLVLGVSQRIPWPSKLLLRGAISDIRAEQAQVKAYATGRDVLTDVSVAYFELAYGEEALLIANDAIRAWQRIVALAADGGQAASGVRLPELTRAETELALAEYDAQVLRELITTQQEVVRAEVGVSSGIQLGRSVMTLPPALTMDLEELRQIMWAHSQELLIANLHVREAELNQDTAALRSYPDFSIGGRMMLTDSRTDADPLYNGNDPFMVELGMSLPIWLGANSAARNEAFHRTAAMAHNRDAVRMKLRSRLTKSYWRVLNTQRLVRLHEKTLLPQAEEAMRVAHTLLTEDFTSLLGVIETTIAWQHFRTAHWRAVVDGAQAVSQLERILGTPLSTTTEGEKR